MGYDEHQAGLVGAGIDLHFLADTDKTGIVVSVILYVFFYTVQSVKLSACERSQRSHIVPIRLGNHLGGAVFSQTVIFA